VTLKLAISRSQFIVIQTHIDVQAWCVYQADRSGVPTISTSVIDVEASDDALVHTAVDTEEVSSRRGSRVEPVPAVIDRCLQRATTAPPTIRHFFKPKPPRNDSAAAMTSENEPDGNTDAVGTDEVDDDDDDVNDDDDRSLDDNDDVVITKISERSQLVNKADCLSGESTVLKTQDNSSTVAVNRKSLAKRPTSGKVPAGKKSRQSSIETLFSSAARNPPKPLTSMSCPICSRLFDATTSNADVNRHIDSCLIE